MFHITLICDVNPQTTNINANPKPGLIVSSQSSHNNPQLHSVKIYLENLENV